MKRCQCEQMTYTYICNAFQYIDLIKIVKCVWTQSNFESYAAEHRLFMMIEHKFEKITGNTMNFGQLFETSTFSVMAAAVPWNQRVKLI